MLGPLFEAARERVWAFLHTMELPLVLLPDRTLLLSPRLREAETTMRRALRLRRAFLVVHHSRAKFDEHHPSKRVYGEINLDRRVINLYIGSADGDLGELLETLLHELCHAKLDSVRHDAPFKRLLVTTADRLWNESEFPTSGQAARMTCKALDLAVAERIRRWPTA